ncbi:hypothetical protein ACLBKU_11705 [Erythrobacter sp. NE805]|uniref:hypothetical protein n=1 Tax=Erythrobacter sp. NE805 TaxID=3389875 RepID=UPI00396B1971
MIARIAALAGALALAATAAALPAAAAEKEKPDLAEAKAIELKSIVSGKQTIDPAKAYIFIRSPLNRSQGLFLKTPSAAEIANYENEWKRQFAKAQERYARDLKTWEATAKSGSRGRKPEEPTAESFAITPIEMRMLVAFGPQFVFDKVDAPGTEKSFSYLVEVEPGEYTFLGPLFYLPGAAPAGTCYCMGSVKFEAKAGQITSLGDFLSLGWADRKALEQTTVVREFLPDRPARPTDWSVPEALAKYTFARAELRAAGKRNNFLNAMVGRIPPVPGVLAYERDVPVDLVGQAEEEAAEAIEAAVAEATAATEPAASPAPTPAPAP